MLDLQFDSDGLWSCDAGFETGNELYFRVLHLQRCENSSEINCLVMSVLFFYITFLISPSMKNLTTAIGKLAQIMGALRCLYSGSIPFQSRMVLFLVRAWF